LNFLLVIESHDFKVREKSTSSDINETWYDVEVDETFTTI